MDQKLFRNGNECTEQVHRWIIWSCYQFCAESNNFRTTWMLLCWITWPFPSRDSQHMDISCPIWNILTHCMLNEKKHGVSDLYQMRTFLQGKAFGPHVFFGHFASLQLTEEPKSHLKICTAKQHHARKCGAEMTKRAHPSYSSEMCVNTRADLSNAARSARWSRADVLYPELGYSMGKVPQLLSLLEIAWCLLHQVPLRHSHWSVILRLRHFREGVLESHWCFCKCYSSDLTRQSLLLPQQLI